MTALSVISSPFPTYVSGEMMKVNVNGLEASVCVYINCILSILGEVLILIIAWKAAVTWKNLIS